MRFKKCVLGLVLLGGVGCSCMDNTEKGMLGGGAIGTGAGALLTHGSPFGMLIGGLFGATLGGIAGNNQDRREDRRAVAQAYANAQAARQMSVQEVIQLSQRQTPDAIIINQINTTGSVFNLRSEDLMDMQQQGVSPQVIAAMQAARPRPVVLAPAPVGVIYADPPPVGVGVVIAR